MELDKIADRISEHIKQSKMLTNYKKMEIELAEAKKAAENTLSIQPAAIVDHILQEIKKPKLDRRFTAEELKFDLPNKIETEIQLRANTKFDVDVAMTRFRKQFREQHGLEH